MPSHFKAFWVEKQDDRCTQQVIELPIDRLPAGEVLIRVEASSLNYKDALSATGHPGVTRQFPHIPGVDAAGTVVESSDDRFQTGDTVIVTGFDLGMNTWGGFAEYLRVPAAWVVPLPQGLSLQQSMMLGTAGLTAALCVDGLIQQGITPTSGNVLVTGASGGVGSLAVAILAKLGYSVTAVTGKAEAHTFLQDLGAAQILSRAAAADTSGKPLLRSQWAGVVDTVGGETLATAIKSTQYGGCVTACGLVGGTELHTTVYPFILRGVCLKGIDSVQCPLPVRTALWHKLAQAWRPDRLETIATAATLEQLPEWIERVLQGQVMGRVVVLPG